MKITKDLIETTPYNDNYYKEINIKKKLLVELIINAINVKK